MAISAYTKTTWANSPATTSAVSAPNLQHIEDQVKDITDAAVSGGASPTKIWTSTNDGNGGQPPAPKPRTATGGGNVVQLDPGAGNAVVLPAGGQWWYWYTGFISASGAWATGSNGGVASGGSTVQLATAGTRYIGWAWRINE